MLDVSLRDLHFRYKEGFVLSGITLDFPRSTHTALTGMPGCGASTLLTLIAGSLRPSSGDVILGQRRINELRAAQRPMLHVTAAIDVPLRWTVQHVLVAAVRSRSLDREDRHREYMLASEKWQLVPLLDRPLRTLSGTEAARVHFARIELLRPAILLADRLLERVSVAAAVSLADEFFRTLRVHGTTVISAPSTPAELGVTDSIVILDGGRVVQTGTAAEVFGSPQSEAAAAATGEFSTIPVTIDGTTVSSAIGSWEIPAPPFQGSGVALVRPADFTPAARGEDSDLIFGIEEAGFSDGRWSASGMLTGGLSLRVSLPRKIDVHKGKLLALRYDPSRFSLLPREYETASSSASVGVVPPRSETR
ncbi:MAG TPA: ATP-binding cassette domain-containing protein [Thermoanaerobaculia bacterium]